ncbi:MAG TPA: superoxide dismutase family protein [Deinococcales bacterium]|nr:superoxide dismutase family protein [Deinococcales bacterium]
MKTRVLRSLLACSAALALGAQAGAQSPAAGSSGPFIARLADANGKRVGSAIFLNSGGRTQVSAFLWAGSGVAPGPHGIHVHTNASCADSTDASGAVVKFGGAGGHLDPNQTGNHDRPEAPAATAHAGDLPNIMVRSDGAGTLTFVTDKLTMAAGPASVQGRSVVVHAAQDDYATDPAGNSGARIACGVVEGLTGAAAGGTMAASQAGTTATAGTAGGASAAGTTAQAAPATPLPSPVLRGEEATVHGATVFTWARLNAVGQVVEVGLTLPMAAITGAAAAPPAAAALAQLNFPAIVQASTFFNHADLYFVPTGHPPVYQVPHWDFHFFGIPKAEVGAIDCTNLAGPAPATVPQGWAPPIPPDAPPAAVCVPRMGFHSSPVSDFAPGAKWMHSLIGVFYAGKWNALEPMISQEALLARHEISLPVPALTVGRETLVPTRFTARWDQASSSYNLVFSGFVNAR